MKFKRRKIEITPPYVAMADIAFNLVLFFLILAKTQDVNWEPAAVPNTKNIANSRVTVSVDNENRVYLNGQQIGLRELADALERELGDRPAAERVVLLKIHKETLAATFEPIMEAVSKAGGEVVHVLEEER